MKHVYKGFFIVVASLFSGCGLGGIIEDQFQEWGNEIYNNMWDETFWSIFSRKFIPTTWYWWILAGLVIYWFTRRRNRQINAIQITIVLLIIPEIFIFTYHMLNGSFFIIAVIAIVILLSIFGVGISSMLSVANLMTTTARWTVLGAVLGGTYASKKVGNINQDTLDDDQSVNIILFAFGAISSALIAGALFGGNIYIHSKEIWRMYDVLLRSMGCFLALAGLIQLIKDWINNVWPHIHKLLLEETIITGVDPRTSPYYQPERAKKLFKLKPKSKS